MSSRTLRAVDTSSLVDGSQTGISTRQEYMLTPDEIEAVQRAEQLLERTHYFAELDLNEPIADARMIARYVLDLAEKLASERSARRSIQGQRDETQRLLLGRTA